MSEYESCSGIVKIQGELKCKHGFPFLPPCRRDPMKEHVYGNPACMDERWTERLYPETGKPEQPLPEPPGDNDER
jgi:hypothetical protein